MTVWPIFSSPSAEYQGEVKSAYSLLISDEYVFYREKSLTNLPIRQTPSPVCFLTQTFLISNRNSLCIRDKNKDAR